MKPIDPDMLIEETNRSFLPAALVFSLVLHLTLIFGTSFGLYRDWRAYGVHSPSTINGLKKEVQQKADAEARQKRHEEQKSQQNTDKTVPAPDKDAPAPESAIAPAVKTPTAPEVAPLPPKAGFTLGEDLDI